MGQILFLYNNVCFLHALNHSFYANFKLKLKQTINKTLFVQKLFLGIGLE